MWAKLHRADADDVVVLVNLDKIVDIHPCGGGSTLYVDHPDSSGLRVKESVEQLAQLLAARDA